MSYRILTFSALAVICSLLSFFILPAEWALEWFRIAAYPLILFAYGVLAFAIGKRAFYAKFSAASFFKYHWLECLVFGFLSALFLVHGHWGIITVTDELLLVSTSQNLHLNRSPLFIWKAYDIEGSFTVLRAYLDKRPIAFPVLLSILHDLTGYRVANAYILNATVGVLGLGLMGRLGFLIYRRIGAIIAMLALASLPLFHYYARGGGFDSFAIVLLLLVMILGYAWHRKADDWTFVAFVYAGTLLCLVRYESPIFALPIGLIILHKWWLDRDVRIPWVVMPVPLLLMLIPLQHHVFDLNRAFWQLDSIQGADSVFGARYFFDNFSRALSFFFDRTEEYPNSPVVTLLGLICSVLVVAKGIPRIVDHLKTGESSSVLAVFWITLLGHFFLMMVYFFGQFDSGALFRFALPSYLFLILGIVFSLGVFKSHKYGVFLMGILFLGYLYYSIPTMAKSYYYWNATPGLKDRWTGTFMESRQGENYLVIDRNPLYWSVRGVQAISYADANVALDKLDWQLSHDFFDAIYVVGSYTFDEKTGNPFFEGEAVPSPRIEIQLISKERLHPFFEVRVARVTGIQPARMDEADKGGVEKVSSQTRGKEAHPESLKKIGEAKQEFYRNLP